MFFDRKAHHDLDGSEERHNESGREIHVRGFRAGKLRGIALEESELRTGSRGQRSLYVRNEVKVYASPSLLVMCVRRDVLISGCRPRIDRICESRRAGCKETADSQVKRPPRGIRAQRCLGFQSKKMELEVIEQGWDYLCKTLQG
jgi:hypothetical protein